jgi:hypothetical protein
MTIYAFLPPVVGRHFVGHYSVVWRWKDYPELKETAPPMIEGYRGLVQYLQHGRIIEFEFVERRPL